MSSKKGSGLFKKVKDIIATKEGRSYLMSTHFWGPFANWGIPIAAMKDISKEPKYISGNMTTALVLYSAMFMRFALKVQPRNLLLFACHLTNMTCQNIQLFRYINYNFLKSNKQ